MNFYNEICDTEASYIIYMTPDRRTNAKNGNTGSVDFSNNDSSIVIQSANNALTDGGYIFIKKGIYTTNRKISLKGGTGETGSGSVNLIGEGSENTVLKAKDFLNDDVIEVYSGGYTPDNLTYWRRGKIANLKIDGNSWIYDYGINQWRYNQTKGNGIVLAWTEEYMLDDLLIQNVREYGIKNLRSYWTKMRDVYVLNFSPGERRIGSYGIKIGEYTNGKYNNGVPGDLFSHASNLTGVHCAFMDKGINIASGDNSTLVSCDTSNCNIGIHLEPDNGADKVYRTNIIGHFFEANSIGLKQVVGGISGTRYTHILNPVFYGNDINIDDNSGQYLLFENSTISGGYRNPIINIREYRADYGGNFSKFSIDQTITKAFLYDGGTFIDYTTSFNNASVNDVPLLPNPAKINDAFYFGYLVPISHLRLNVGIAGVGNTGTVVWEYYNGSSWSTITVQDNTMRFKISGTNYVIFNPVYNQTVTTINGISLFWIRARVMNAGYTTQPLLTQGWVSVRPFVQFVPDFFVAEDTNVTNPAKRLYVATNSSINQWSYVNLI